MTLDEFHALDPLALWAALPSEHKAAVIIPLLTSVFAEVVQDDDGTDASDADRDVAAGICQSSHREIYDALNAAFPEILGDDLTALHGFSAEMLDDAGKIAVRGLKGKRMLRTGPRYGGHHIRLRRKKVAIDGFKNIGSAKAPVWEAWTAAQIDDERVRRHPDQAPGPSLPTFIALVAVVDVHQPNLDDGENAYERAA